MIPNLTCKSLLLLSGPPHPQCTHRDFSAVHWSDISWIACYCLQILRFIFLCFCSFDAWKRVIAFKIFVKFVHCSRVWIATGYTPPPCFSNVLMNDRVRLSFERAHLSAFMHSIQIKQRWHTPCGTHLSGLKILGHHYFWIFLFF